MYVGADDGNLHAVNTTDGTAIPYTYPCKWPYFVGNKVTSIPVVSTPAVSADGETVFVAADKKLHAVNRNGSSLWTYEETAYLSSSPAISPDGSIVYFASANGGRLHAINASSGKGVWTFDTGGQIAREQGVSISSNGSTVFVTAYKAYQVHLSRFEVRHFFLHAVRASDGTKKWTYELYTQLEPPVTPTTAILSPDDSTLYLGNWDDNLYAVRAYGKILWKYNAGYQISDAIGQRRRKDCLRIDKLTPMQLYEKGRLDGHKLLPKFLPARGQLRHCIFGRNTVGMT